MPPLRFLEESRHCAGLDGWVGIEVPTFPTRGKPARDDRRLANRQRAAIIARCVRYHQHPRQGKSGPLRAALFLSIGDNLPDRADESLRGQYTSIEFDGMRRHEGRPDWCVSATLREIESCRRHRSKRMPALIQRS